MAYTIGIGVLLDEHTANRLRDLELLLFYNNENCSGLSQPPHITIKVPFEVQKLKDIESVANRMTDLAKNKKPFSVSLTGFGYFEQKVIYAAVEQNKVLRDISNEFIDLLTPKDATEAERARMIFHSTLAMNLSPREFLDSQKILANKTLLIKAKAVGLGLFIGLNDLSNWSIIRQLSFDD